VYKGGQVVDGSKCDETVQKRDPNRSLFPRRYKETLGVRLVDEGVYPTTNGERRERYKTNSYTSQARF